MKNIHVIQTDKPTWLHKSTLTGVLRKSSSCIDDMKQAQGMNIYITSDEEIKLNDYVVQVNFEKTNIQVIQCVTEFQVKIANDKDGSFTKKKIILTTDQDLIKDGVQPIDDEFLEWWINNPSCENVEVETMTECEKCGKEHCDNLQCRGYKDISYYNIIIPKEKPKQETLEEVAERLQKDKYGIFISKNADVKGQLVIDTANAAFLSGMIEGAKWQQERSYSEEDMREAFENGVGSGKYQAEYGDNAKGSMNFEYFIEQFKKK